MGGGEHRTRPGVEARAPVADRSGCRCRAGCGAKVDEEGCDLSEEVAAASELAHDVRIGDAARARCIALFTDAGVVSRMSATSAALNPSPSRRISTARYQYCTLGDGQVLQRGDEGQLDALPLQVRRRRIRLVIDWHIIGPAARSPSPPRPWAHPAIVDRDTAARRAERSVAPQIAGRG